MQYKILFSAAIMAMLVMIGCNSGDTEPYKTTKSVAGKSNAGKTLPDRPNFSAQPAARPKAPAVGTMAPEIIGPDTDGAEFKLSDYRGKIVMVDFWGDW
jgi:AhpC/TSA family